LPVETIGSRFGELPRGLTPPTLPRCDANMLAELLSPAFSLALLGAIESLMAAVLTDRLSGDKHDPNQELLHQSGFAEALGPENNCPHLDAALNRARELLAQRQVRAETVPVVQTTTQG
jgi:hypothetical protein